MPTWSETRYARSGELFIAYRVGGEGPLDLLLAPGYNTHVEQNLEVPEVRAMYEGFARFARVIVFDKRGAGLSDALPAGGAIEEGMEDILAVLDDAGSERAFLYGSAEGGPLVAFFAATYPERTAGLILAGTHAKGTASDDYPWAPTPEGHADAIAKYAANFGRRPVALRTMAPSRADDPVFARTLAKMQRYGASPGAAIAYRRTVAQIDVRHVLPTIRVPTIVVHRTGDRAYPVEGARWIAEQIPAARMIELPGDDHLLILDPEEVLAAVEEFVTGSRHEATAERVLATVLFTDIVGSTERAAEMGDRAWRRLLEAHHALVREHIDTFGGQERKATGDGFLATFDGPARAVRCACAIRDRVAELDLTIRAGLHTGEIELIDGDVGGIGVHIGARVAGLAAPGTVLASRTVKDLVAGSGIAFENHGAHTLKGVPDEWELHEVVDAGA